MTVQLLRPYDDLATPLLLLAPVKRQPQPEILAGRLLRCGAVTAENMVSALALHAQRGGKLSNILLAQHMVTEPALYSALADHWGLRLVDPTRSLPDPRLIDRYGAQNCLAQGVLPFAHAGPATVILAADPDDFDRHRKALTATFGPVMLALAAPPPD